MKDLIAIIRSLLDELDVRRRWVAIAGLFILGLALLFSIEYATGWNYYRNLEKKAELLSELHALSMQGIEENGDLYPIYQETVRELSARKVTPPRLPTFSLTISITLGKAISGAALWIILALVAPFGVYGENNKIAGSVLLGLVAILFGFLGAVIPTIVNPWVNYLGFPLLQLVVIITVSVRSKKEKGAG